MAKSVKKNHCITFIKLYHDDNICSCPEDKKREIISTFLRISYTD